MVIVDTSIWINHFRRADGALIDLLERPLVLTHPAVVGELACGTLRRRGEILDWMRDLPRATVARDDEVLRLIEHAELWGQGIGWVDAHLVAAARLGSDRIWTADRRLRSVCADLEIAYTP